MKCSLLLIVSLAWTSLVPHPGHAQSSPTVRYTLESGLDLVASSPDGRVLATTRRPENRGPDSARPANPEDAGIFSPFAITLLDATGGVARVLEGHAGMVRSLVFSARGDRLVSTSDDGTAKSWNVATGEAERTMVMYPTAGSIGASSFSPDGRVIATYEYRVGIQLWDAASGRLLRVIEAKGGGYGSERPIFMRGGRAVTVDRTISARLWEVSSGRLLHTLIGPHANPIRIRVSPDDRLLLTEMDPPTGQNEVTLWDVASTERLESIQVPKQGSADFSPDGKSIAIGRDPVRIWDVTARAMRHYATGDAFEPFQGRFLGFSPDGRIVITRPDQEQTTLCLWSVGSGALLGRIDEGGPTYANVEVWFLDDGRTLATMDSTFGKGVRVSHWSLPDAPEVVSGPAPPPRRKPEPRGDEPADPTAGSGGASWGRRLGVPLGLAMLGLVFVLVRRRAVAGTPNALSSATVVWSTVGFVLTALYVFLGLSELETGDTLGPVFGFAIMTVAALCAAGTVLALMRRFALARVIWLVAGILGLPLGLILLVGARAMKKAADEEV